ncbi:MAG: hypothetical protein CVU64_00310 [Deltaproteobacteria bacterium HGW-Deltaproteobacteria-21]|nr:MAG: hypothetical protein CVU64_00310 [Deltaproteobacteria bacterium HGW-Deltaproteobacteria-21]
MKRALLVAITFVLLIAEAFAYEVRLDVPWVSQLDIQNGLGTDWSSSMNCGPTALVMSAAYLKEFSPTTRHIKKVDEWLVQSGLVEELKQYNLPEPGTGQSELRKAAASLYGLGNTRYFSTKFWGLDKETQLRLIVYSLRMNYPVIVGVKGRMDQEGQNHWMVLTGLRDRDLDGHVDEVHVNDPGTNPGSYLSKTWYPLSRFKNVWWGSIFFLDVDASRFVDNRPLLPVNPAQKRLRNMPSTYTENLPGIRTQSGSALPLFSSDIE